ncbi:hypothetical protein EHH54_42150, partial [Rhizobium leguminosarum]
MPAFEIVLRLAFKFFGNRIQNHETALQQIGAPFHHPNLKSALTENFATRPAPGFIDVMEACSLSQLRPQERDLQALLD